MKALLRLIATSCWGLLLGCQRQLPEGGTAAYREIMPAKVHCASSAEAAEAYKLWDGDPALTFAFRNGDTMRWDFDSISVAGLAVDVWNGNPMDSSKPYFPMGRDFEIWINGARALPLRLIATHAQRRYAWHPRQAITLREMWIIPVHGGEFTCSPLQGDLQELGELRLLAVHSGIGATPNQDKEAGGDAAGSPKAKPAMPAFIYPGKPEPGEGDGTAGSRRIVFPRYASRAAEANVLPLQQLEKMRPLTMLQHDRQRFVDWMAGTGVSISWLQKWAQHLAKIERVIASANCTDSPPMPYAQVPFAPSISIDCGKVPDPRAAFAILRKRIPLHAEEGDAQDTLQARVMLDANGAPQYWLQRSFGCRVYGPQAYVGNSQVDRLIRYDEKGFATVEIMVLRRTERYGAKHGNLDTEHLRIKHYFRSEAKLDSVWEISAAYQFHFENQSWLIEGEFEGSVY